MQAADLSNLLPLPTVLLHLVVEYVSAAYIPSPAEAARLRSERSSWRKLDALNQLRQIVFETLTGARARPDDAVLLASKLCHFVDVEDYDRAVVDAVVKELRDKGWLVRHDSTLADLVVGELSIYS